MAEISTSRRSIAGILLAVAGAVLLIDVILGFAQVTALQEWPHLIADVAIGVAFLILAIGSFRGMLLRIPLIVVAIGWLLLALDHLVPLPSPVGEIGVAAAALGTLVAAVMALLGREVTNVSAIAFLVTAIIAAIILAAEFGLALGGAGVVFALLLGL